MAVKYHFIGWCKEGNHDKVWGIIQLTENDATNNRGWTAWHSNDYVVVWGRRGKTLQTKIHKDSTQYAMNQLADKKKHKPKPEECYKEVDKTKLDEVYPEFEQDLKETAFWSKLKL
jgi:predicted DNA-binding WGR domain protein